MANEYSLPWAVKNDVSIHANEFVQIATVNRGFRRLLDNDKWLIKYGLVITPEKVAHHTQLTSSGKALKVEVTNTGTVYYIPLYTE